MAALAAAPALPAPPARRVGVPSPSRAGVARPPPMHASGRAPARPRRGGWVALRRNARIHPLPPPHSAVPAATEAAAGVGEPCVVDAASGGGEVEEAAAAAESAAAAPASTNASGAADVSEPANLPPARGASVAVAVEPAPANGRRLYASVDVAAPAFVVWRALTDYDRLSDFIPGLAENRCLARSGGGATLLQVGEQPLALGLSFRARVVLDIQEHEAGLPASLWAGGGLGAADGAADGLGSPPLASEDLFPRPRSGLPERAPARDITFALIEGDFQAFRGVWRIQDGGSSGAGGPVTRVSYALFVRPQVWLPVHLVQARIRAEVAANLAAVRAHTERQWLGGA